MSQPNRFAPPTQLDVLRSLLSEYSSGNRSFEAQFQKSLSALQQQALPELGQRLARTTTSRGLRWLILQACETFDWPEWDAPLIQMLQMEEDMELFQEGCTALAGLCTKRARGELLRLRELRKDPERQAILDLVLANYEPRYSLEDYFSWLQAGQSNSTLARLGAMGLSTLCGPEQIPELMEVIAHGDALARRLSLRTLAFLQDPSVNSLLLFLLQKASVDRHAFRELRAFAPTLEGGPKENLRNRLLTLLGERFGEAAPEAVAALRLELGKPQGRASERLAELAPLASHPRDHFLLKASSLLAEGTSGAIGPLVRKTLGEIPAQEAACAALVDETAGLLAAKVESGDLPLAEVLPVLEEAFLTSAGGDALLIAYLRILPPEDKPRLERVLAVPDITRRERCIEILGAREEDALVPVFLKAMNGPDVGVSRLAVRQLGKLASGAPAMMVLFRSEQLEGMRQAVHFFGENRIKAATKPLMSLLPSESPDDLLVDAAVALGKIGDPVATSAMLTLLHDGKPLLLQVALAEALGSFKTPAASLGLLAKAERLKIPQVLILALEGALSAFPSFELPFPSEQVKALEMLTDRCCDPREGAGQWARAGLALKNLFVHDGDCYRWLKEKFATFTLAARHHSNADREAAEHMGEVLRLWSFRATSLSMLDEREEALKAQLEALPSPGEKRILGLAKIQETLSVPELVLSQAFSKCLVEFVASELAQASTDAVASILLCEIGGLLGTSEMVTPLRDVYAHAPTQPIKEAARKALLALGIPERDIDRRGPIKKILVLEPNAFFRKRLASALEAKGRTIAVVSDRNEAGIALGKGPVDLILSESQDPQGDLGPWLELQWEQRRCAWVLLSSASHDLGTLAGKPWVIGRLYKPYPLSELAQAIEE